MYGTPDNCPFCHETIQAEPIGGSAVFVGHASGGARGAASVRRDQFNVDLGNTTMSPRIPGHGEDDAKGPRSAVRRNHRIRASEVQVLAPDGVRLGIMRTSDAISRALALGLDLVEVAPNEHPPICQIMDFEQYFRNHKDEPPNRWNSGAN